MIGRLAAVFMLGLWIPSATLADVALPHTRLDLTDSWAGYLSLIVITLAYVMAMFEDVTFLRKSKPMLFGAALIWAAILLVYREQGDTRLALAAFRENLQAYIELLLFIMVSMTYLNVLEDMRVFDALRLRLMRLNLSYRALFWITGVLVFLLSSTVNGLTSGLLVGSIAIAVGRAQPKFVAIACVNIVVACNAGGSFSPLGGISTLFVWQDGALQFVDFFKLFIPCCVNFLIPALIMHRWVPTGTPTVDVSTITLARGTRRIVFLFALTIALAVAVNVWLELPPSVGMMGGLALLQFFSYFLMRTEYAENHRIHAAMVSTVSSPENQTSGSQRTQSFAIFEKIGRLEWDTLLFFYGAMMGIGGLGFIGYLDAVSTWLYGQHSPTLANIMIGLSSAFIDNGTLMFAVLNMHPNLPQGQWLLVTLTLGVGGSLLAIGSAPGIGLLGISKGHYTFGSHLRWFPVILLGYFSAIGVHFLVNARVF